MVESTSDVVEGTYGHRTERLIYGVFTTPENSIYGSAICAFRIQDVMDSFDAAFKVISTLKKKKNKKIFFLLSKLDFELICGD